MNLVSVVKEDILNELRNGNIDILTGLQPVLAMQYGLALQKELGDFKDPSPINDKGVSKAMIENLKDSGVKEMLIKRIEQDEKEFADKIALTKGTDSLT